MAAAKRSTPDNVIQLPLNPASTTPKQWAARKADTPVAECRRQVLGQASTPGTVTELYPRPAIPDEKVQDTAGLLRQLAIQVERGEFIGVSIIATTADGKVRTFNRRELLRH